LLSSLRALRNIKSCPMRLRLLLIAITCALPAPAHAAADSSGHADPIAPILLALVVLLTAAKTGSEIFERLDQPAVLGELLAGVILGNLVLLQPQWHFFEPLRATVVEEDWAVVINSLGRLGVIILLFEVGLESTVAGLMKVGASSLLVALLGLSRPLSSVSV